jgi:ribosomal protein S18 acetylase RimI-like enzyme
VSGDNDPVLLVGQLAAQTVAHRKNDDGRTDPVVTPTAIAPCADAAVIAALHQATVTVAYRGYFRHRSPPTAAELQDVWTRRLADPTAAALVACRDGRPAGSVMTRADPEFGEGQIVGLHVLPSEWGQRIGSALHDAALAALSTAGYRTAGLWVIAANQRARRMYENRGWLLCPGIELCNLGVTEVRYRRELLPLSRPEGR